MSMESNKTDSNPHEILIGGGFTIIVLLTILSIVDVIDIFGWIKAGGGTLLMVFVTVGYVILTYELVRETRKGREEDRQRHRKEQIQERINIRNALITEIEKMRDSVGSIEPNTRGENVALKRDVTYTTVYENNTDKLGYLTQDEARKVVEAYTEALDVRRDLLRSMDEDLRDVYLDEEGALHISRFNKLETKLGKAKRALEDGLQSNYNESYQISN